MITMLVICLHLLLMGKILHVFLMLLNPFIETLLKTLVVCILASQVSTHVIEVEWLWRHGHDMNSKLSLEWKINYRKINLTWEGM